MYPDTQQNKLLTPRTFLLGGVFIILVTLTIAFWPQIVEKVQPLDTSREEVSSEGDSDDLPVEGQGVETTRTFISNEQKYEITFPKTFSVREESKKQYNKSKRLFEGRTSITSHFKPADPNHFKIVINAQRIYEDGQDTDQLLTNKLVLNRLYPKGDFRNKYTYDINEATYVVTPNVRNCGAPYITYFDTFSKPGTYILEIHSNRPYEQIEESVLEILDTFILDRTLS